MSQITIFCNFLKFLHARTHVPTKGIHVLQVIDNDEYDCTSIIKWIRKFRQEKKPKTLTLWRMIPRVGKVHSRRQKFAEIGVSTMQYHSKFMK